MGGRGFIEKERRVSWEEVGLGLGLGLGGVQWMSVESLAAC